jgi:signal transduction histidine kinase/ligand-binding sensor domain-containing protein
MMFSIMLQLVISPAAKPGAMKPFRLLPALLALSICLAQPARSALAAKQPNPPQSIPHGISIRFEHLNVEDGLSQNASLALLQDSHGYLWIGTQDGLNRYDGYGFTIFRNDPENPDSLGYNSIIALYEDRDGYLWIGTWGGGLDRYDPASGKFSHFRPDPKNPASLSGPVVPAIAEDHAGRLWVGTNAGLDLFDRQSGAFVHFRSDPDDPATLSSDVISAVYPDSKGNLWVGSGAFGVTGAGLNRMDPATGKVERIGYDKRRPLCMSSQNISSIVEDPDGNIWVGNGGYSLPGGGIDRLDPVTGACRHFQSTGMTAFQIQENNVTRLMFDRDGRLWVTTWGGGLYHMEPLSPGKFDPFMHDPSDPNSISNNNLFSILQDRSGVIWIGSLNTGLNKLNLHDLQFRHYRHNPADPASLSSNLVGAFAEDVNGMIWVATWEAGLERFDRGTGTFKHYWYNPKDSNSLSSNLVMALDADRHGYVWAGTLGGGLNRLDPQTGTVTRFMHDPQDPASLGDDNITSMLRTTDDGLWIGTMSGLERLDAIGTRFVHYPVGANGLDAPPVSFAQAPDTLFIGTWGGGLCRLPLEPVPAPAQAAFTCLRHDPANPDSLANDNVFAITQTYDDGMLWLGTQGGLVRYNVYDGTFKTYGIKEGLRNATVVGVMVDRRGKLWLTTNNGLARFDRRTETFHIYDYTDGLQSNEFNSNAWFVSPTSGEMFVGGPDGFNAFDPQEIVENETPPQVVITNFKVFNEPAAADLGGSTPLRLNYDQNFISFEFAALDFHSPQKNAYAYRLEGFDKDWVDAGTRHYASYTNLPGGRYTFRVRAANSDGIWNEEGVAIPLVVTPPFWETWPFRIALALGLIGLVAGGVQLRIRSIREQNRLLEGRVEERTHELQLINEQLKSEIDQRQKAEQALAQKAAQEAVISERTRLARELHDAVTQTLFAATMIADVLPALWEKDPADGQARLEELRQLARGALAEMRTLLVELRPNALVEIPLPTLLRQLTDGLIGRARIAAQLDAEGDRKLPPDVQVAFYRIAQEALNNVARHAHATQVVVTLRMAGQVRLTVADNGSGFGPDGITADHLGLKIMRERAESAGAKLSIYSEPGEGTQISVFWE